MRVQAPDGKVIEFPESMSADQVGAAMRTQYPPTGQKPDRVSDKSLSDLITGGSSKGALNPRPFGLPAIPDPFQVAGKINETLAKPLTGLFRKAGELDVATGRKTPEKAELRAKQYGKFGTDLAEGLAMPWTKAAGVPGAVGRTLQSGLLGGLQSTTSKEDSASKAARGGLAGLLGGMAGEALSQPLRFIQMARAARAQAADKAAFDKSMTETLNAMAAQGHEKDVAALRSGWEQAVAAQNKATEKAADSIVKDFKKLVPSWADLPGGVQGLQDMVVGQGQNLVSKKFDAVMKEVIDAGRGTRIALPRADIEALGMKTKEFVDGPAGPLTIGVVDAGEAAARTVGKWAKEPGAYRRVANALEKIGIGDPAVRAEYKASQGLISFVDKSGALKGDKFNPEALVAGMNRVRVVDELRRRGLGDVFRGPLQAARGIPRQLPKEPVYPKPPVPRGVPAQSLTEGVRVAKNPAAGHPWLGGLTGEAIGHAAGLPTGIPFAIGALASQGMPKEIVTRAKLTPEQLAALARAAGLTGTGVRSGLDALLFPPRP